MDNINKIVKSLILIIALAIIALIIGFIVMGCSNTNISTTISTNLSSDFSGTVEKITESFNNTLLHRIKNIQNKNLVIPTPQPHPYNQCIKLLIDQVNHEESKVNFKEIKSVCFELMKEYDKEEL